MLAENSFYLGYSLSNGAIPAIDPVLVVSLLEAGKAEVLLKVAKEAQERKRLYEIWKKKFLKTKVSIRSDLYCYSLPIRAEFKT